MPRSVQEIQNDIAKVKAEIALKNKYMNGYSAPTSNRGWGAYFQGDRSVHQKALDDQTAWARALQQQEFQAAEAEANRKLQEKIAEMNRQNTSMDKMDENMLMRNKAATKYSYAQKALEAAKNSGNQDEIDKATMDLALAQHELDYYNKRTGFISNTSNDNKAEETGNSETPEVKPVKTDVKVTEWKGIKSIKTDKEKAELENEIKNHPAFDQDPKLQEALNHIQSIVTDETKERNKKERAAKIKATITEWENNPDPLNIPEGFEPDWVDGKATIRPKKDTKK
jgi:hypothetical protein